MFRTRGTFQRVQATGLLPLFLLAGCSAAIPPSADMPAEDLPIEWQKSGSYSRLGRSARLLIRDPASLAQVPVTEVPVDFNTQMVLLAALGPTPTSDLGIRITRVWREGHRIRVQERQIHPGTEEGRGLDPASPWTVVVIPRSDLNVEGYSMEIPRRLLANRAVAR